jgi:hypothetical protein
MQVILFTVDAVYINMVFTGILFMEAELYQLHGSLHL